MFDEVKKKIINLTLDKEHIPWSILKALKYMNKVYAAGGIKICEFNDLLEPFLYYLKGDNLRNDEKRIGDIMRKNIFHNILACWNNNNTDFIVGIISCLNGYINTYSDGSWNYEILYIAMLNSKTKRIKLLALFVEYAGYKTNEYIIEELHKEYQGAF